MHRRHFLQLSGYSLAGLMFSPGLSANGTRTYVMELPDEVWIRSGGQLVVMESSGGSHFRYKDIEVICVPANNSVGIHVSSPTLSLGAIVLKWKHQAGSNTKNLGDHWERTYGDVAWLAPDASKKMPWYFIQADEKNINCFGVKTGGHTICDWTMESGHITLTMDTRSGGTDVQLGARVLHAADIITAKDMPGESAFEVGKRFCMLLCEKPRLAKLPVYGINDWYFAYGNNSYDLILQHTSLLADLVTDTDNRPFSVVDAGWAYYSPLLPGDCCWQDDYSRCNDKFKDMHKLVGAIDKMGMRPALWTRPLCAAHDDKPNRLLPSIPGRDNPKNPVLDPTIAENMERIKHNISLYKTWGYHMVKHDFSTYDLLGKWGFQMTTDITTPGWRFHDNSKTTAEIILHLYQSIREAAGDMYLIGCNTLSHLAAGIFEINRIGDDTSGNEWDRTRKMGVNTLAFRSIQHNHFYAADADCVGLTNKVPWSKNKQWMELLAGSGTPLFISAQPDALGAEQRQFIKNCFATAAKPLPVGEPLDWLSNPWPTQWKLDGAIKTFDWS